MDIDEIKNIEQKWRQKWEEEKIYSSLISKKKKFFSSIIIPYVNGRLHIGHTFTFTRTDAYSRYKRMKGYNVLLAQGFHATGEPIVGAVNRLKKGDTDQINTFKLYGATDKDLEEFKKQGPGYVARYWTEKIIEDSKNIGFSVDWSRIFITAGLTPQFSRFIEWQYNTLRKMGYVVQGTHPVIWCPNDQSPTGDHDRLEGEGESPVEYTILKFRLNNENTYFPCATLRPETIYGATNVWLNPFVDYVKARVNNETWIISKEGSMKLKDQLKDVKIIETIRGKEFLGKRAVNPVTRKEIPILPSEFVDPASATGVVMSVPSHAPYDYIALLELIEGGELKDFGTSEEEVTPISVVKVDLGEHTAVEVSKKMGIKSLREREKLEEATNVVYKKEFHAGILNDNCKEYVGMKVSEVKAKLVQDFLNKGIADSVWETTGTVICRCKTKNYVKILENQWFLKFSDEEWKSKVRDHVKRMIIIPEHARQNFENTIEWLKDKACVRKSGLGTKLPWDDEWIIETLSDSTIYMAYYTIARIINEKGISSDVLNDEAFDYIFLGIGSPSSNREILDEMKREFEYFYPVDFRNSGKDLIQNHLTFYLFHHLAIWPEKLWPVAISVNGFVNVEGEKMSKSKGNIIPLKDLMNKYGADLVRINIAASAENLDDADWRAENIESYLNRISFLFDAVELIKKSKTRKVTNTDKFLLSRMQNYIHVTENHYENAHFRSVIQTALFETTNTLRWYLRRTKPNKKILKEFIENTIKLITPIVPHIAEELWEKLGNEGFISLEKFPKKNKKLISMDAENGEKFIENTIHDINGIKKIIKFNPKKANIFIAENWKFTYYEKLIKSKDMNKTVKKLFAKAKKDQITYLQFLQKKSNELKPVLPRNNQIKVLQESKNFIKRETGLSISVNIKIKEAKSKISTPIKPAILMK